MDWFGALLFVGSTGSTTSLLVGVSLGGTQCPWTLAATLAPSIVGALGCAAFVAWQMHTRLNSLLPTSLFYNASAIAAFYCALVNGFIVSVPTALLCCCSDAAPMLLQHCPLTVPQLYTALYYVPLYLTSVRGASPFVPASTCSPLFVSSYQARSSLLC